MELSPQTEEFIQKLNIKSSIKIPKSKAQIENLYTVLNKAYSRTQKLKIEPRLTKINNIKDIPIPSGFSSRFLPDEIRESIYEDSTYFINYETPVQNRTIRVFFICNEPNMELEIPKYIEYIKTIILWFHVASNYSSTTCGKTISIYLFRTEYKKMLPTSAVDVIGVKNVNSGFSDICQKNSEIVIYRKEEWLKVLIHESFHSLGMEFSQMNIGDFQKEINVLFPIKSELGIYEAWAESWAIIMNISLAAYYLLEDKSSKKDFVMFYEFLMMHEKLYCCYQVVKILNHMGLTYDILINPKMMDTVNQLYKEETNVFAYYIIKLILIYDHIKFLNWCKKNNPHFMRFMHTKENLTKLGDFIKSNYKNKSLVKTLKEMEKYNKKMVNDDINNTLRMSLCELI